MAPSHYSFIPGLQPLEYDHDLMKFYYEYSDLNGLFCPWCWDQFLFFVISY